MTSVSNQQLYDAIERLESKIVHRIELLETEVRDTTNWRNQLTGKLTVVFAVIGLGINFLWDTIFNRK